MGGTSHMILVDCCVSACHCEEWNPAQRGNAI